MIDSYFKTQIIPMTSKQWRTLPRNAAYRYEYAADSARLTPRPKFYHASLALATFEPEETLDLTDPLELQPLSKANREQLPPLFSRCFQSVQPFGSLEDTERLTAATQSLNRTWKGEDGPLISQASFQAKLAKGDNLLGAVFVTLIPPGSLTDWQGCHWDQPPPEDAIEKRLGHPHLTWIFVDPWLAGRGVGTHLLIAAVNGLLKLGYDQIFSTFLYGNESSMLWHWRNGFQLLAYPGSWREMRKDYLNSTQE